jgi:fibronectin-binding autotransporter adhesin
MPVFSVSKDFITKNGIITEGTADATSSTGQTNIIQSGGGIAATRNIIVGTSATIYGSLTVYSASTLTDVKVTTITATSTSSFIDLNVRNVIASGSVSGTIVGNINTASNLSGGSQGQIAYQTSPGNTGFVNSGTTGQFLQATTNGAPVFTNTGSMYVGNSVNSQNILGGSTGSIAIQSAAGTTAFIPLGTVGYVLAASTSTATWQSLASLGAGSAVTSTNIAAGGPGQIPYQTAYGQTSFINTGSTGTVLVSNWTGSPVWQNTLTLAGTTAATSTSTGALQVVGGVGVGGALYIGGQLTVSNTQANTGTNTSNALYVAGGAYIDKSLVVVQETLFKGPVTFSGSATYILSTNTFYTDNLLEVHTPPGGVYSQWLTDDGKDIGLRFHYYTAGTDTNAALVLDNATKELHWYSTGAESAAGDFSTATFGTFRTGIIRLNGNNANTGNTNTGDLQVLGGIGVGGSVFVAGVVTATSFTGSLTGSATSATNIIGGNSGQIVYQSAPNTTSFVSSGTTGTVLVANYSGSPTWQNTLTLAGTTAATSTQTGALQVAGGAGIGGNLYAGGFISVGTTATNSVVTAFVSNNNVYASYTSNVITNSIQVILDSFSTSTYRTAKYTVQIVDGANIHAQEILLFHNGSTVYKTEYAVVYNNSELGAFDADVSGGLARLLFTASPTPTALTVKMVRIGLTL